MTERCCFSVLPPSVEARYHIGMNKGRGSMWREGAGYHPELLKLVVTAAAKEFSIYIHFIFIFHFFEIF